MKNATKKMKNKQNSKNNEKNQKIKKTPTNKKNYNKNPEFGNQRSPKPEKSKKHIH